MPHLIFQLPGNLSQGWMCMLSSLKEKLQFKAACKTWDLFSSLFKYLGPSNSSRSLIIPARQLVQVTFKEMAHASAADDWDILHLLEQSFTKTRQRIFKKKHTEQQKCGSIVQACRLVLTGNDVNPRLCFVLSLFQLLFQLSLLYMHGVLTSVVINQILFHYYANKTVTQYFNGALQA